MYTVLTNIRELLGISGHLLNWFKSYLSVENKELSFLIPLHHGLNYLRVCPKAQYSVLYFLIYINDIVTDIEASIRLFADDTSLYNVIETAVINSDLQKMATWSSSWLVTFNPLKTESMICSRKRDRPIHPPLPRNKHIGLTFTDDAKWKYNISSILKKHGKDWECFVLF